MNVNISVIPETGLRVVTIHLPWIDSASVGVYINAGSRNENEDENGIAHFLEHMAFKGTTTRDALEISSTVECLGSQINAYTSQETTVYYVNGLSSTIKDSVEILGDVLTKSVFDEADIEMEKGVILQEIHRSNDDPNHVAQNIFQKTAYPNQALGRCILGPEAFIQNATRANFLSFVNRHYTAENMLVVGAGNIEHEAFVDLVAANFSEIKTTPALPPDPATWIGGSAFEDSSKFEQVLALIGWKSSSAMDDDLIAARMLSVAIGDGMSSPLFQEVREKRGLVYAVGAFHDYTSDSGYLGFYAGMTPENVDQVIDISSKVLPDVSRITDRDIERARNSMLVAYATIKERPSGTAQFIAKNLFQYKKLVLPDDKIKKIKEVTRQDMINVAIKTFATNPTVALVGPVLGWEVDSIMSKF